MSGVQTRLEGTTLVIRIPMRFQRRGGRKRIVAPDGSAIVPASTPQPDGTLVKALARAWRWQRMLDEGVYAAVSEIGDAENISKSYVSRILRLALLAPDIVDRILAGSADQSLMLEKAGATAAGKLGRAARQVGLIEDLGESRIEVLTGSQERQLLDANLDRGSVVHKKARAQAVQRRRSRIQQKDAVHPVDARVGKNLLKIGRGNAANAVRKQLPLGIEDQDRPSAFEHNDIRPETEPAVVREPAHRALDAHLHAVRDPREPLSDVRLEQTLHREEQGRARRISTGRRGAPVPRDDEAEDADERREVSVTTIQYKPGEEIGETVGWGLRDTVEAREKLPAPPVRLVELGEALNTADAAFDGAVDGGVSRELIGFQQMCIHPLW
jgi:hypothetical protein